MLLHKFLNLFRIKLQTKIPRCSNLPLRFQEWHSKERRLRMGRKDVFFLLVLLEQ